MAAHPEDSPYQPEQSERLALIADGRPPGRRHYAFVSAYASIPTQEHTRFRSP